VKLRITQLATGAENFFEILDRTPLSFVQREMLMRSEPGLQPAVTGTEEMSTASIGFGTKLLEGQADEFRRAQVASVFLCDTHMNLSAQV